MTDEDAFEPHLGRLGTDDKGASSFKQQVMRAVGRAGGNPRRLAGKTLGRTGRFNARGRGAKMVATLPRDMGWTFDREAGTRVRPRRVIAKIRIVKARGPQSRAAQTHLRYLRREGVRYDQESEIYSALDDAADVTTFLDRGDGDRHQFRLIMSPEDGAELGSLRDFTRRLMVQMERDLETTLDWVAIDHYNTGHPHSHIVIRGVTDRDKILNIAGDYIAYGIRHRARELVTLELGPQTERELRRSLGREIQQDGLTRLDRALLKDANPEGLVDLGTTARAPYDQQLLIGRLQKLERMGLARRNAPGRWLLAPSLEGTLRHLGERAAMENMMRRTIAERGLVRRRYAMHRDLEPGTQVIGRVLGKGNPGQARNSKVHLLIDGIDGQVHAVEMTQLAARSAQIDRIVAIRRPPGMERRIALLEHEPPLAPDIASGRRQDHDGEILAATSDVVQGHQGGRTDAAVGRVAGMARRAVLEVRVLSAIDLEAQVTAHAATWLDRALLADAAPGATNSGFGHELHNALMRRQHWLIEQGLARRDGNTIVFGRDLLATLAQREAVAVGERLAHARGLGLRVVRDGERITGQYRATVTLISGTYAVIESGGELALLPRNSAIEKAVGRGISGLVLDHDVDWQLGRRRGPARAL